MAPIVAKLSALILQIHFCCHVVTAMITANSSVTNNSYNATRVQQGSATITRPPIPNAYPPTDYIVGEIWSDGIFVTMVNIPPNQTDTCKYPRLEGIGPEYLKCCNQQAFNFESYVHPAYDLAHYNLQTACNDQVTYISSNRTGSDKPDEVEVGAVPVEIHSAFSPFFPALPDTWGWNPNFVPRAKGVFTRIACGLPAEQCRPHYSRFESALQSVMKEAATTSIDMQKVNMVRSMMPDCLLTATALSTSEPPPIPKCIVSAARVRVYYSPVSRPTAFDICDAPVRTDLPPTHTGSPTGFRNMTIPVVQWGTWQVDTKQRTRIRSGTVIPKTVGMYENRVYLHFDEVNIRSSVAETVIDGWTVTASAPGSVVVKDVLLEVKSDEVSSLAFTDHAHADAYIQPATLPIDFADLAWPYDMRAMIKNWCKWGLDCRTISEGQYKPTLALPERMLDLHPAFSGCELDKWGALDPPKTLTPMAPTITTLADQFGTREHVMYQSGATFLPALTHIPLRQGASLLHRPDPTNVVDTRTIDNGEQGESSQNDSQAERNGDIENQHVTITGNNGMTITLADGASIVNGAVVGTRNAVTMADGRVVPLNGAGNLVLDGKTINLAQLIKPTGVSGESADPRKGASDSSSLSRDKDQKGGRNRSGAPLSTQLSGWPQLALAAFVMLILGL